MSAAYVACPTCGSVVRLHTADEGTSSFEPIPMRCSACGKPHPGFEKTASWPRSYVCPCGSSKFEGTVTFRG